MYNDMFELSALGQEIIMIGIVCFLFVIFCIFAVGLFLSLEVD